MRLSPKYLGTGKTGRINSRFASDIMRFQSTGPTQQRRHFSASGGLPSIHLSSGRLAFEQKILIFCSRWCEPSLRRPDGNLSPLPPGVWPGGRGRGWVARAQGRFFPAFEIMVNWHNITDSITKFSRIVFQKGERERESVEVI